MASLKVALWVEARVEVGACSDVGIDRCWTNDSRYGWVCTGSGWPGVVSSFSLPAVRLLTDELDVRVEQMWLC